MCTQLVPKQWPRRYFHEVAFPWFLCSARQIIVVVFHYVKAISIVRSRSLNTLRLRQNGRHFPDDVLKRIFLNENDCILIRISLKPVSKGQINNTPALVQIMAWRRTGDEPLSEPMMSWLTDACMHYSTSMVSILYGEWIWYTESENIGHVTTPKMIKPRTGMDRIMVSS